MKKDREEMAKAREWVPPRVRPKRAAAGDIISEVGDYAGDEQKDEMEEVKMGCNDSGDESEKSDKSEEQKAR